MKKVISYLIVISLILTLSSGLPLSTEYANAGSLKKPKLQTFSTGAMEFFLTVASVNNGVALSVEGVLEDKKNEYGDFRVVLYDYETGKKTITKFDTYINYDGDAYANGFVEGWAIVGQYGGVKQNPAEMGYTYINPKGKAFSAAKYAYLTHFKNGLAGCRYYVGDDIYTGVLQSDGKVRFAVFGNFNVTIGNNYVTMSGSSETHTYDLKGKKIELTQELLDKDYPNYKDSERKNFYKNHASKYTKIEYVGSNRFRVEDKKNAKIVDSNNKTILTESLNSLSPRPILNNNKLYFESNKGIHNKDGKLIISINKYESYSPADGDCFATKLGDKFQMFNSSGKEVAVSNYNPMIFIYQGRVTTLFNWNLDSEYRPNGLACIYTDIDLSKTSSTSELKKLYNKYKFQEDVKSDRGLRDNAKKLLKNSKAANPGLFAIMSELTRGLIWQVGD